VNNSRITKYSIRYYTMLKAKPINTNGLDKLVQRPNDTT